MHLHIALRSRRHTTTKIRAIQCTDAHRRFLFDSCESVPQSRDILTQEPLLLVGSGEFLVTYYPAVAKTWSQHALPRLVTFLWRQLSYNWYFESLTLTYVRNGRLIKLYYDLTGYHCKSNNPWMLLLPYFFNTPSYFILKAIFNQNIRYWRHK